MPSPMKATYQKYRRWILYLYAFVSVSFAAGTVYGFPALRRTLRQEGSTLSEQQFGAVFTVGAWSAQGSRFFTGLLRDRFGAQRITVFALLCSGAGFAGLALCDYNNPITLGISIFIMGFGSGVILCVSPVASLFPGYAGSIMSSLSGAFQISGLVFLVLLNIGTRKFSFMGFCVVLVGLAILAVWLLPKGGSFHELRGKNDTDDFNNNNTIEESEKDQGLESIHNSTVGEQSTHQNHHKTIMKGSFSNSMSDSDKVTVTLNAKDTENGIEAEYDKENHLVEDLESHDVSEENAPVLSDPNNQQEPPTALEQILSLECILFYAWFSFAVIPLQYYVGSIGFQLEDRGDDDGFYTNLYAAFYSSAALFSPVGGWISDNWGLGIAEAFAGILCAASFFLLASNEVSLNGQIAGLATHGIGRMFVFGLFFAHVGKRFGYQNFGAISGLGLLMSAVLSLLQYPMIAAAAEGYAQEMNLLSGATYVFLTPYFGWLVRKEYRERQVQTGS